MNKRDLRSEKCILKSFSLRSSYVFANMDFDNTILFRNKISGSLCLMCPYSRTNYRKLFLQKVSTGKLFIPDFLSNMSSFESQFSVDVSIPRALIRVVEVDIWKDMLSREQRRTWLELYRSSYILHYVTYFYLNSAGCFLVSLDSTSFHMQSPYAHFKFQILIA